MTETALVVAEKLDVAVLFTGAGMEKILKEIETKAMAHVPDISTDTGRDDIKSLAHKVARSKTLIDDLGKDTVFEWKKKAKAIDEHRKTARDFLDNLKVKVRQPLTDWEAIEAEKKAEEDARQKVIIDNRVLALSQINCNLPWMEVATMTDAEFDDKFKAAESAYLAEIEKQKAEEAARKAESERLEKVRLEQEAEAKRLAEVQKKIDEANAAIAAEKKALEDAKRVEQERKDREAFEIKAKEDARIKAEKDAAEAIEKARIAFDEAETARILQEAAAKAEAERKESLKPDKDRLVNYGKALMDVPRPELKDKEAKEILVYATGAVYQILKNIAKRAEELK